ncbi:RNA-binding KH domain-containing protein RCF3-like [Wolffia australiana]
MSFPFKHSKRGFDGDSFDQEEKEKWQKDAPSGLQQNPSKTNPGATVFRILCPASKSGSVIGKGGGIITKIRQETGAKIKIEEILPGCEERVVVITGPDREIEDKKESLKKDDVSGDVAGDEDHQLNEGEDKTKKEEKPSQESSKPETVISAAQKALLLVFERIAERDPEPEPIDDEDQSSVVARVLVLSSHVGCILGKAGSVIKQLSADSGALIRILPRDKVPACASPQDELVQITGNMDAVRKALQSVSQQLIENPPRDRDSLFPGSSSRKFFSPPSHHFSDQGTSFPSRPFDMADFHPRGGLAGPKFADMGRPIPGPVSPEIIAFQMICSGDKVGSIIGKGGNIVKIIEIETGSEIKILETSPDSDDRIVVISGPALPDDRVSPVQDALLRVQNRIAMAVSDDKEPEFSTKILVSSAQTGCLIGRGGAIVTEMRKLSGAHIRVMSRDQSPTYISENEVAVKVSGKFESVQEALLLITTKLKQHIFNEKFHFPPPVPTFVGRRELSPLLPLEPPFPHSHYISRFQRAPPASWQSNDFSGGDGLGGADEYGGPTKRRFTGFSGGVQPSMIPLITIDVVVPRGLVHVVRGEDGGCLHQICQISGANVTITESRPGSSETVFLVSGTPDQAHAAQCLIQAFMLSETTNSS